MVMRYIHFSAMVEYTKHNDFQNGIHPFKVTKLNNMTEDYWYNYIPRPAFTYVLHDFIERGLVREIIPSPQPFQQFIVYEGSIHSLSSDNSFDEYKVERDFGDDEMSIESDGTHHDALVTVLPRAIERRVHQVQLPPRISYFFNRQRQFFRPIALDTGTNRSCFKLIEAFTVLRHVTFVINIHTNDENPNTLRVSGIGHVGGLYRCLWTPGIRLSII